MSSIFASPSRHSFSHTKWITVGPPTLEGFIRISDSGSIQRYVSLDGATVRFHPLDERDTVADFQVVRVRGSVVVMIQREEGFEVQDHWVLSVPAWAIEGWDEESVNDTDLTLCDD
jgi:hypothetical protein